MRETNKPCVLIIDDDPAIIELLSIYLEFMDYEVRTAPDGAQAVAIVKDMTPERPIDAIMVDLMMPVMDGLRFIHTLRTELKCALPVLALTGMSQPDDVQRALRAGANAVLSKPVEPKVILDKLAELLGCCGTGVAPV